MTCFVPSLKYGRRFKISIHSWVNQPDGSAYAKAMCKEPGHDVKFDARVFIHGHLVA
jgi:hypothetical protein